MATVTHYIYSHNEPRPDDEEPKDQPEDAWQTESTFATHRTRPPPRFVPAIISECQPEPRPASEPGPSGYGHAIASWYKSMTGALPTPNTTPPPSEVPPTPRSARPMAPDHPWFISRAVRSCPSTPPPTPPTLAEILARDPPPEPGSIHKFTPPVWLAIGPANKGFAMLQRSGWVEGQGLGAATHAPPTEKEKFSRSEFVKVEQIEREVEQVDIIDLTISDSDSDEERPIPSPSPSLAPAPAPPSNDPYAPKALLTPLPTVLKSDRLGIGLKAKTVGPHRASQKRVTHSAEALAAHTEAAEALRRRKAKLGRGRKGFEKEGRREEMRRRELLTYLNQ